MSNVAPVRTTQPLVSRPPRFQPDYVAATETALAFARPLATGFMTFAELEARLLPHLAGPEWQREGNARDEACSIIESAVSMWRVSLHAR